MLQFKICLSSRLYPHPNTSNIKFWRSRENFQYRKGYISIKVQIMSGPRCEILDIVARWPRSVHDNYIFRYKKW